MTRTADKPGKLPISEHDLQKLILDYLALHRIFHYRQNTGAMKKGKHYIRFGVKGLPDIIAVVKDRLAGYKKPKSVEFMDKLPVSGYGKVMRREIRETYWQGHEGRIGGGGPTRTKG